MCQQFTWHKLSYICFNLALIYYIAISNTNLGFCEPPTKQDQRDDKRASYEWEKQIDTERLSRFGIHVSGNESGPTSVENHYGIDVVEEPSDQDFAFLAKWDSWLSVNISGDRITPAVLKYLHSAKNLQSLAIGISSENGEEISEQTLAPLKKLTSLVYLHITGSGIQGGAAKNISSLTNLVELHFGWNAPVTDDVIAQLGNLQKLRLLALNGPKITANGLNHLLPLTNLEAVSLTGSTIKKSEVESLHKALPKLTILGPGWTVKGSVDWEENMIKYRNPFVAAKTFKDRKVAELVVAAASGNVSRIDDLIADGANINVRGKNGMTPLFWAMQANSKSCFRRLLEKGADPNFPIDEPGYFTDSLHHEDTKDTTVPIAGSWSVLNEAAGNDGDSEWVELLLKHGANPNVVNPWGSRPGYIDYNAGRTPIATAATGGAIKNIKLLIAAGAVVDHQDNFGYTPLMLAVEYAGYDCVLCLLGAGANPRIKNNRNEDVAYMLIERSTRGEGVDPNSERGRQLAQVIDLLKKKGISIEAAKKAVQAERQRIEQLRKKREEELMKDMEELDFGELPESNKPEKKTQ